MKFFLALTLIATVASASVIPQSAIEQIIEAITAARPPVVASPAIVPEPVAVGPAFVEFPEGDGGAVTAPIVPSPVIIGPIPEGAPTPLVQIILNINQAGAVAPAPVVIPEIKPEPVQVVDSAPEPVQVVEIAPEVVEIEPIQVIETAPVPVEPVIIGTPTLPAPAVILPEELN